MTAATHRWLDVVVPRKFNHRFGDAVRVRCFVYSLSRLVLERFPQNLVVEELVVFKVLYKQHMLEWTDRQFNRPGLAKGTATRIGQLTNSRVKQR